MFQPLFGSVVVCYLITTRMESNLLRQRTRDQRNSNDRRPFKFGSWENEVAALKLIHMNLFRGEILTSEAFGEGTIEEEEVAA